jgi:dihydrodipicolinate synthase/N-acetylneuraminate lyase
MHVDEARARLKGIFSIVVTPFASDGAFDFSALGETIDRVISLGYDGLLIGGTYGEFPAMTPEERAELFRRAMDAAAGRAPVLLCSAASDLRIVRELTELASALGGIPMMTPPYVSEVTDEHICAFFRRMSAHSSNGIFVYNAPGVGLTLPPPLIERIAGVEGVLGIKQGDLSPAAIDFLANRLRGRIMLFCASDLTFPGPTLAGFDGISSTNSCALPELLLKAYRALERGDARTAAELHRVWYPLRELIRRHGQPQTTKAAMKARGFKGGSVRPPLRDLEGAALDEVAHVVKSITAAAETTGAALPSASGSG